MKLLIISALILISQVAKADLDRLVMGSNGRLQQVSAPRNNYNHPEVNVYHQNGTSDSYRGDMIYHSDGTASRVQTSSSLGVPEMPIEDLGR